MDGQNHSVAEREQLLADAIKGSLPADADYADGVVTAALAKYLTEVYSPMWREWDPETDDWTTEVVGNMHRAATHLRGWARQPFLGLAAVPIEPPTIGGMLYPRQRHIFSSEPGHGKTWVGLWFAAEVMKDNRPVVWVNTDDAPEAELLERLLALGVTEAQIEAWWHYYRPDRAAGLVADDHGIEVSEIRKLAKDVEPTLVVLDSFNPTLGLQGLNYMDETEVEAAWRIFASPFTDVGAAFLALDHLTKAADNRGRYSIGSQRKLAGCSVHIGMKPVTGQPFGRGVTGRAALTVHKDRSGHLGPQGSTLGDFVLNSETGHMTVAYVEASQSENADGDFRPTEIMKRVSAALQESPAGLSMSALEREVKGKAATIREATQALLDDRYVTREPNRNGGFTYRSDTPYTGSLVPLEADTGGDGEW